MNYSVRKIEGVDCSKKYLLEVEGDPILFANCDKIANLCGAYLTTKDFNCQELPEHIINFLKRKKKQLTNA